MKKIENCDDFSVCPVTTAIAIIGGKWKIPVLYNLRNGTLRFSQLKKSLPLVTQKMLTQQLRELEQDGLVSRKIYAEIPPKVEYSITPIAKKLEPILDLLCDWGMQYQGPQPLAKRKKQAL